MKPHPRIRKTIKWGGAVVTVLLVVAWVGGNWLCVAWSNGSGHWFAITSGGLHAQYYPPVFFVRGFGFSQTPYPFTWLPVWVEKRYRWHLIVPLWIAIAPLAITCGMAWRLDTIARRRAKGGLNLCPKCNYDRTGILKDAKCPECGAAPVGTDVASARP